MAGNIDPRSITWEADLPPDELVEEKKSGMNIRQKVALVCIDILLLAVVAVAIGMANQHPDQFTPMFFKIFFSLGGPVLVGGVFTIQRLRTGPEMPMHPNHLPEASHGHAGQ